MEEKKWTFEDWKEGKTEAYKKNFNDQEWTKVKHERKRILQSTIDERYKQYKGLLDQTGNSGHIDHLIPI